MSLREALGAMSVADRVACKALMRGGSKSFYLSSLTLPARVRIDARALYAYCRVADDAIDDSADPKHALAGLHARLDAVYARSPGPEVADRALAVVVQQAGLPRALLDALLEGFAWDAEGRRYETIEDLHGYAARVAGTVGAMMAVIMESRDAVTLARACELGVAMQLTNIARDVGEDARNGRLYLPLAWMREAGVDPQVWLQTPVFDARIATVVARLLAHADALYAKAECGVRGLPRACRASIQTARLVYADIGRTIAQKGMDSVQHRAVVGIGRKAMLMARGVAALLVPPGHPMDHEGRTQPLAAVQFLVDAAVSAELPRRTFYQRSVRVLDQFERHAVRSPVQVG
jgi:15-cis-phytoene synthase